MIVVAVNSMLARGHDLNLLIAMMAAPVHFGCVYASHSVGGRVGVWGVGEEQILDDEVI